MQLAFVSIMSVIERDRRKSADGDEGEGEGRDHAIDGGPLLLLVDDDDDIRSLLGDFLRGLGYETIESHDGADALAALRTDIRLPMAIITDLAMPRLDGWSFIAAVRADRRLAGIPIVVVSASTCPPPAVLSLCKPLQRDRLVNALAVIGAPPPRSCGSAG